MPWLLSNSHTVRCADCNSVMPQPLPAVIVASTCVEGCLLLFHLSVTVFIGVQVFQKNVKYSTAFFKIYFLLCFADIGNYLATFYMQRMMKYGLLTDHLTPSIGGFVLFFSGFCSHFQFASHTAIAANRYTVILHPIVHTKIWRGMCLKVIMTLYAIWAVAAASISLGMQLGLTPNGTGGLQFFVTGTGVLSAVNGYVLACAGVATCFLCFFIELRTFVAFRSLTKHKQREQRDEYRLLIFAMSCFFAHVLMSFAYVCFYFVVGETPIPMQYIIDLLSFSGPICLFATSKTVRIGYARFYHVQGLCRKKTIITVGSSRQHFRHSG